MLSAGMQKNNLDETKKETTKRFIGNGAISINPSTAWGIDMNYNNFGIQQLPGTLPLNDSVRIRQVNQTITITPRYTWVVDTLATHTFSLTGSMNDVDDRNVLTKQYGNMRSLQVAFNHNSSFNKRGNSVNSGLNYNNVLAAGITNTQYGATLGYTDNLFKNAVNANINLNYNLSYVDKIKDGSITNGTFSLGWLFAKKHSLNISLNIISTKSAQFEDYVEAIGSVGYSLRFK
jgi:hypothetical protein